MIVMAGRMVRVLEIYGKCRRIRGPSKIERDLTNGPLSKLLELLDTQV